MSRDYLLGLSERYAFRALSRPSKLDLVVLEIPIDEVAHALLDGSARPIADVAREILDVGPGVGHVAELQRQKILLGLSPQAFLEHLDVPHQLDGLLIADVIDPIRRFARRGIRSIAAPGRAR